MERSAGGLWGTIGLTETMDSLTLSYQNSGDSKS